jgi:hypothetical protein
VRIYGHYPVIDGEKTTFYRHAIHTFDFTALDGKEKWTAYKFAKNVYDIRMPSVEKAGVSDIEGGCQLEVVVNQKLLTLIKVHCQPKNGAAS